MFRWKTRGFEPIRESKEVSIIAEPNWAFRKNGWRSGYFPPMAITHPIDHAIGLILAEV